MVYTNLFVWCTPTAQSETLSRPHLPIIYKCDLLHLKMYNKVGLAYLINTIILKWIFQYFFSYNYIWLLLLGYYNHLERQKMDVIDREPLSNDYEAIWIVHPLLKLNKPIWNH